MSVGDEQFTEIALKMLTCYEEEFKHMDDILIYAILVSILDDSLRMLQINYYPHYSLHGITHVPNVFTVVHNVPSVALRYNLAMSRRGREDFDPGIMRDAVRLDIIEVLRFVNTYFSNAKHMESIFFDYLIVDDTCYWSIRLWMMQLPPIDFNEPPGREVTHHGATKFESRGIVIDG